MLSSFKVMQFIEYIKESNRNIEQLISLDPIIEKCIDAIIHSLRNGGTIFFCGNGGSAADSQHLAAELMGRFLKDRKPLKSIALTVDTSALTAIGNDYGFDQVFSRQLDGLGKEGDVLYSLSTSGNSVNVVNAMKMAKTKKITTIGMTGSTTSAMSEIADLISQVPSEQTNHIQEMHIIIGHYICGRVESALFNR